MTAATSPMFATVCRGVLQRSPLWRLHLHFLTQSDSTRRDWSRDIAFRTLCEGSAQPRLGDESVARGRHKFSKDYEIGTGEQERAVGDTMKGRVAIVKMQRNIQGARAFASRTSLRPLSSLSGSPDCTNSSRSPVIAVGMSGGVDSSVAALLLKRQGYEVFGMFMRNWDSSDEAGSIACSMEQDYEDTQRVCKHLGIRLFEVDYQRRYWMDVFESFTRDCAVGLTPNPDLACNQHIKFDALLGNAKALGAERLATGHYARLLRPAGRKSVQLLRGIDHEKDQSYFLASVAGIALEKVIFPLGSLCKSEVRKLGVSEGLITANKRSSAGICFVGRRNFADFISEYVEMKCGPFIAVEDGSRVGTHEGIAAYTHGQRARIGGKAEASYVVGKDVLNNVVFVAQGSNHPALFCTSAVAGPFLNQSCSKGTTEYMTYLRCVSSSPLFLSSDSLSWIAGELPSALAEGRVLKCFYKARYRQSVEECTVCLASAQSEDVRTEGLGLAGTCTGEFEASSFCRLERVPQCGQQLQVRFGKPARAITPGQALVLYLGDICLGVGRLLHPGPTLYEQNCGAGEWKVVRGSSLVESRLHCSGK